MYNANILETSACIEYSLNASIPFKKTYKTIKAYHNTKISTYVNNCNDKWHTDTIEKESYNVINRAANELVDVKLGRGKHGLVRKQVRDQSEKRLKDYFDNISIKKLITSPDHNPIANFYQDLYNTPEGRAKLIALQTRKKATDYMPEPNDLIIIAESIELLKNESLCLISGDGHFTDFKEEI